LHAFRRRWRFFHDMGSRMFHLDHLAKDSAGLAAGFTPLAFLGQFGTPAVLVSLLNIAVFALLRYLDIRTRSRERLELARLRMELEATTAQREVDAHGHT
jgi:hypothetical protein